MLQTENVFILAVQRKILENPTRKKKEEEMYYVNYSNKRNNQMQLDGNKFEKYDELLLNFNIMMEMK